MLEIFDQAIDERKKYRQQLEIAIKKQAEFEAKSYTPKAITWVFRDAGVLKMDWHFAPAYMSEFQPDDEDPLPLYTQLRFLLLEKTKEVEHSKVIALIKRYRLVIILCLVRNYLN